MDVLSMLKEKQQEVISYEVRVQAQRREEDPRIFTSAAIEHVVTGRVEESLLANAIELSEGWYCAAIAMLSPPLEVTTTHRIIAPDG
jgi:putative redox protein